MQARVRRFLLPAGVQCLHDNCVVVIVNRCEAGRIVDLTSDGNSKRRSGDTVDRKLANEMAVLREFHNFAWQLWRNRRVDCVAITGEQVPGSVPAPELVAHAGESDHYRQGCLSAPIY